MELLPLGKTIDRHSYDILKASKSLGVFPTPVDKIVAYSELMVQKDIDISTIHVGYISRNIDVLKRAVSKVRGMLDRTERVIYLDLSQKSPRKNFVKLHETGHHVLPWQKEMHDLVDDDDASLSADVIEEFEAEANHFASVTLFQHDRFDDEMTKLGLGIEASIHLSKHFGASIHATLRRYVQHSRKKCALIVLEDFAPRGGERSCKLRNVFQSDKFQKVFGELYLPLSLDGDWVFVNDFYYGRKLKQAGNMTLPTASGIVEFSYEFFNNSYNAFVLAFPVGETNKSRTTFYTRGNDIN